MEETVYCQNMEIKNEQIHIQEHVYCKIMNILYLILRSYSFVLSLAKHNSQFF